MFHGRKRLSAAVVSLIGIAGLSLSAVAPSYADPDIDDVQARVDRLYHEAEVASERFNDLSLQHEELSKDLTALKADQKRQQNRMEAVRTQVEGSVVRQYLGESMGAVGQVVVSDDPSAFLQQLSTMSAYNELQDQVFDDFATEAKALTLREEATAKRAAQLAEAEEAMAEEKAAIDKKFDAAESLLDDLKAKERERVLAASRSAAVPASATGPLPPASGRAAAAVAYARAQVGDAYVYGAVGPNAFDCSGLTMRAWGAAGVGLPHSSGAQMGSGPRVSSGSLQPGDLVFYYSPVSHVGIYIGNGLIVHAANPSTGVRVAGVFSMPFSGAVRPG